MCLCPARCARPAVLELGWVSGKGSTPSRLGGEHGCLSSQRWDTTRRHWVWFGCCCVEPGLDSVVPVVPPSLGWSVLLCSCAPVFPAPGLKAAAPHAVAPCAPRSAPQPVPPLPAPQPPPQRSAVRSFGRCGALWAGAAPGLGPCSDLGSSCCPARCSLPVHPSPSYCILVHPNPSHTEWGHDRKCLQKQQAKRVNNGNKMRSSGSPHREETRPIAQGSCQSELHRALERLAASQTRTHEDLYVIPIPNCDRNGNFHPKQCHPALDGQRGKCWCVDRKTGVKLPGFLELKGDLDCHQPADSM
uniref:Thyroglobulin type-1 domain-containing protein n=1 Tax=Pavo cristatus TaxID=9049 RepID=A0A8C9FLT1_PAVCR